MNLKVRVKPTFPASVTAGPTISVSKANGVYTVGANYSSLASISLSSGTTTKKIPIYDSVTGGYYAAPVSDLASALASQAGSLIAANNLSDVTNAATARANLGITENTTYDTRAAAAAASPTTTYITVQAEDERAVYKYDASSTSLALITCANGRKYRNTEDIMTPEMFGAVGDGTTNDTTAMANAVTECVTRACTLRLGPKAYLVSGSGSQMFSVTGPITIEGVGGLAESAGVLSASRIVIAAGVSTTRDVFLIKPPAASLIRDIKFKNFRVTPASGAVARHAFHFDTSADTSSLIADVEFDGVRVDNGAGSVNSLYINNGNGYNNGAGGGGATGSVQGGTFNFTAENCYFGGNITLTYAGDTIRFEDCLVSANTAIINQVSGAANFIWQGNNCSLTGGLTIRQALKPIISDNEFEQQIASTQVSLTANTNAITAAGSPVLNFASVSAGIVKGMLVTSTGSVIPTGAYVLSTTATTVTISANVTGAGVTNGQTISFGGVMLDIDGTTGAIDTPIIENNVFQSNASIGNTVLLRINNATDAYITGNRFAPPIPYIPFLITSNALRTRIGRGNYWTVSTYTLYVQDGSTTTRYPFVQYISGTTGASTVAAGATNYTTPGVLNATESLTYLPLAADGLLKNLSVWSQAAPGAAQTYTYTLRNEAADTTVTCQISGAGSNSAQDTTHQTPITALNRISLKIVASGGAGAVGHYYSYEYHSF